MVAVLIAFLAGALAAGSLGRREEAGAYVLGDPVEGQDPAGVAPRIR